MTVALPFIKVEFGLSAVESGMVVSAFFAAYAIMQVPGGMLADRFGVRRVATAALVWWSAFTAFTGLVGHYFQMLAVRFLFGLGEGSIPRAPSRPSQHGFQRQRYGERDHAFGEPSGPSDRTADRRVGDHVARRMATRFPGLDDPRSRDCRPVLVWRARSARAECPDVRRRAPGIGGGRLGREPISWHDTIRLGHPDGSRHSAIRPHILRVRFRVLGLCFLEPYLPNRSQAFHSCSNGVTASLPFVAGFVGCIAGAGFRIASSGQSACADHNLSSGFGAVPLSDLRLNLCSNGHVLPNRVGFRTQLLLRFVLGAAC